MEESKRLKYWRKNLRVIIILLLCWFLVSFVLGILFADQMNHIHIGGFKLGFWFAQQGSIFGFIIIIFIYTYVMNKMDKAFSVKDKSHLPDEYNI